MSLFAPAALANVVLLASFGHYFYGISLSLVAIFLILLVLIQRGRGGGLAGAFGGMGGQSAFGTKAGDTFTRITIGVAIFWILLSIGAVKFLGHSTGSFGEATPLSDSQMIPAPASSDAAPAGDAAAAPAGDAGDAAPTGDAAPAGDAAPQAEIAQPADTSENN